MNVIAFITQDFSRGMFASGFILHSFHKPRSTTSTMLGTGLLKRDDPVSPFMQFPAVGFPSGLPRSSPVTAGYP